MRMRLAVLALMAFAPATLGAEVFRSAETRTHLLELYSSEGCSSCPPAEAWLGKLHAAPGLWRDFVPVSFHVTYWDKLGWKDRFARRDYTTRQYRYSAAWGSSSVYTPCFVLDGRDAGTRVRHEMLTAGPAAPGVIEARIDRAGEVEAVFTPNQVGDFTVTAALLGGGIVSPVRSGENGGRTLQHDFVVLALAEAPLVDGRARLQLTAAPAEESRRALAVWVTTRGDLRPLQATGGWLGQ